MDTVRVRLGALLVALAAACRLAMAQSGVCVATAPDGLCGSTTQVRVVCDTQAVCTCDGGSWNCVAGSGSATAAGDNTQVQINDAEVFGADPEFTYNKTTNTLNAENVLTKGIPNFNVKAYGAAGDGVADDTAEVAAALTAGAGATVFFPEGTYLIDEATGLTIPSNTTLIGPGTLKYDTGTVSAALLSIDGASNVVIDGLVLDGRSNSQQFGNIQIEGASSNITIRNVRSDTGYAGVWVKQGTTIRIEDCYMRNQSHPIYLGENEHPGGGAISGVTIEGCDISTDISGGDAIKTVKTISDLTVAANFLHDNAADGLDAFVSGERFTVVGNHMYGNGVAGIDIKSNEGTFPPADWGKGRQGLIQGNHIWDNDAYGIRLFQPSATEFPYFFSITANHIYLNGGYGIELGSPYVSISDNQIIGNCVTGTTCGGMFVGTISGGAGTPKGVTISDNVFVNNGNAGNTNSGLNLAASDGTRVEGNIFETDTNVTIGSTQETGININSGTNDPLILGNYFGPGLTNEVVDSGTTTQTLSNYGITSSILRQTLINHSSIAVLGDLGQVTIPGGVNGHKITFTRPSTNFFEATAAGGAFAFRPNGDTTNRLTVNSGGATVVGLLSLDSSILFEGSSPDEFEGLLTQTNPTADVTHTLPNANSNTVQPATCGGTDKMKGISSAGVISCEADGGGGGGDVTGPASSVDNEIARFDGTTGKIIQATGSNQPTISDTGTLDVPGVATLPAQQITTSTDGSWTDGVNAWTSTTKVPDALDDLNELINYLAPADADSMASAALTTSGTAFFSGCLSAGNTNYKGAHPAGTCGVTYISKDATFDMLSPSQSTSFNKADESTLAWLINGSSNDTFDMAAAFDEAERGGAQSYPTAPPCSCPTPDCCGAAGNIEIDSVGIYGTPTPFPKWQKGNAHAIVVPGDLRQGWNYFSMTHSSQATADFDFFYDNDAGSNPSVNTPTIAELSASLNELSGIKQYKNGSTFNLDVVGSDLFDNVYTTSPLLLSATVTITPTSIAETDGSVSGVAVPPAIGNTMTVTNKVVTTNTASQRTTNLRFTVTPRDPYASYTAVQSASANRLYDSFGTTSTAMQEPFDDENRRLPAGRCSTATTTACHCSTGASCDGETPSCPGVETCVYSTFGTCPGTLTGQFVSGTSLVQSQAQVYQGSLVYPTSNFSTGFLPTQDAGTDYSAFTGSHTFIRSMFDTGVPHSSGKLQLANLVNADVGAVGAGEVNVELKLCGVSGWLDLGKDFNPGTFTGADGDGIRTAQATDKWNWSVGTLSTSSSSFMYIVRITFRTTDSAKTVTLLDEVCWRTGDCS